MKLESLTYLSNFDTVRRMALILLGANLFIGSVAMSQTVANRFQSSQVPPARAKEAKRLFKQRCAKCHGSDGLGSTSLGQIVGATNFTDLEWQDRVDDKRLINSIKHGRGQMPAFGEKLADEQIASLVSYVRAFKK